MGVGLGDVRSRIGVRRDQRFGMFDGERGSVEERGDAGNVR